jgi:hypothetical protein
VYAHLQARNNAGEKSGRKRGTAHAGYDKTRSFSKIFPVDYFRLIGELLVGIAYGSLHFIILRENGGYSK